MVVSYMPPDTAINIVRRIGYAVFREWPHGLESRSDVDGMYFLRYYGGSFGCLIRRMDDNRVGVTIDVPKIVGARYERRHRYFVQEVNRRWYIFNRVIIDADEEDALTAQTLVFMALLNGSEDQ